MGNVIQFKRPEETSEVVDILIHKRKPRARSYTKEKILPGFMKYFETHGTLPPKTYWYKYPELVDIKVVQGVYGDERELLREMGWSEGDIEEFLSKKKESFSELLRRE